MIMLTVVGEDVSSGAAWYHGWLAGTHLADDEILGVDYPSWAAAWDARYTSGERFVACYEG
jgi:hypothetical protein